MRVERGLIAALVGASVMIGLAGCGTTVSRQAGQGDFATAAEVGAKSEFSQLSTEDHFVVCTAYQELNRFSDLDRCMPALRTRLETEELTVGGGLFTYNQDYTALLLDGLEAKKFLALGDYEQAREYGLKAYAAAHRKPRGYMNEGLSAMTAILTLGLNNPNAEDSAWAELLRQSALIEPTGLMATIEGLRGAPEAERYRAELETIWDGQDKSEINNGPNLAIMRRWMGQAFFVTGDYEHAYTAFTRDDRGGFAKAGDGFFEALLFVEKPILEPIAYAVAGTNFDDLGFAQDFPLDVMVHRAAFRSGRIDVARTGFDRLLQEPRLVSFAGLHFNMLHERGLIALQDGDRAGALEYLRRAVEVLEEKRAGLESEDYKLGFIGDKNAVYADLVRLLLEDGETAQAFEYAERAKARALVDMLAGRATGGAAGGVAGGAIGGAAVSANASGLIAELEALERQSLQVASLSDPGAATRRAEIDDTRAAIAREAPELASLISVQPAALSQIQDRLATDETLLVFFGAGDAAYVFVVTRDTLTAKALQGQRMASTVVNFRRSVRRPDTDAHVVAGRRLYDRLIRPIEGEVAGRRLTIVPHGPLHYLPFSALNDGTAYLGERYALRLLPSASVLEFLDKPVTAQQDLLALGNPDLNDPSLALPGAEAETRAIDTGWSGSRVLLRQFATEANFKRFAGDFRYLHLASHGQFNADEPMRSRLLLTPGDGEDGSLTVEELYNLRLNADLVTLSACETALGNVETGDDVIGLTRGFLYAGARSVVASLWPVSDDATAVLMARFYENLKTMEKAEALRDAMSATRDRYPHPVYWSAFHMTGAW